MFCLLQSTGSLMMILLISVRLLWTTLVRTRASFLKTIFICYSSYSQLIQRSKQLRVYSTVSFGPSDTLSANRTYTDFYRIRSASFSRLVSGSLSSSLISGEEQKNLGLQVGSCKNMSLCQARLSGSMSESLTELLTRGGLCWTSRECCQRKRSRSRVESTPGCQSSSQRLDQLLQESFNSIFNNLFSLTVPLSPSPAGSTLAVSPSPAAPSKATPATRPVALRSRLAGPSSRESRCRTRRSPRALLYRTKRVCSGKQCVYLATMCRIDIYPIRIKEHSGCRAGESATGSLASAAPPARQAAPESGSDRGPEQKALWCLLVDEAESQASYLSKY